MPTTAERERARHLATSLVSWAIMLVGVALVALAIALLVAGGVPFVILAFFVGLVGAAILLGGFFFHLVPLRLDEMAEKKREADRRAREGGESAGETE